MEQESRTEPRGAAEWRREEQWARALRAWPAGAALLFALGIWAGRGTAPDAAARSAGPAFFPAAGPAPYAAASAAGHSLGGGASLRGFDEPGELRPSELYVLPTPRQLEQRAPVPFERPELTPIRMKETSERTAAAPAPAAAPPPAPAPVVQPAPWSPFAARPAPKRRLRSLSQSVEPAAIASLRPPASAGERFVPKPTAISLHEGKHHVNGIGIDRMQAAPLDELPQDFVRNRNAATNIDAWPSGEARTETQVGPNGITERAN